MTTEQNATTLFLEFSRHKLLDQYWPRMRICVESLTDEQVWWRPNKASNSVGNLLLHLNGNVRQWLVASFNHLEDARKRQAEFDAPVQLPASALIQQLDETMQQAAKTFSRLTETDLLSRLDIQGYHVTGLAAIYQAVEHFGLHYGQLIYITKMLCGEDLGFYRELNQTGRPPESLKARSAP
ncbi:MAG: DUF1572 family protein [Silvibacterium sp.]